MHLLVFNCSCRPIALPCPPRKGNLRTEYLKRAAKRAHFPAKTTKPAAKGGKRLAKIDKLVSRKGYL